MSVLSSFLHLLQSSPTKKRSNSEHFSSSLPVPSGIEPERESTPSTVAPTPTTTAPATPVAPLPPPSHTAGGHHHRRQPSLGMDALCKEIIHTELGTPRNSQDPVSQSWNEEALRARQFLNNIGDEESEQ